MRYEMLGEYPLEVSCIAKKYDAFPTFHCPIIL